MIWGEEIRAAYRGRRVLVTGASGFIGRWVARALTAAGAELWLAGRDPDTLRGVAAAYAIRGSAQVADLAVPGTFARLYQEAQPEVTFNLAGYGVDREERDPGLMSGLNTRLVAEIAQVIASDNQGEGMRLVHVGSGFEYGLIEGVVTEESAAAPKNLYGQTKLEGTRQLLEIRERTGLRAIVARVFTVYGPGEHPMRLLPSILRAGQTGESLPMTSAEQRRDFTYVGDVAEGLLRMGRLREAPGLVNLATGKLASVREFAECAAKLAGLRPEQLQFGALPTRPDEVAHGAVETSLLERLLGWRPATTIREGIRRTIEFGATSEECGATTKVKEPR